MSKPSEVIDYLGEGDEIHQPRFRQWPLELAQIPSDMDPEVALVMIEETSHLHKCVPQCSYGGIPPGSSDQMPGENRRHVLQQRVADGQIYELAESDDTIHGRDQSA